MRAPSAKNILAQHKLAASKRFGQNFLVNPRTAESIVTSAHIQADETVIEVGVGLGALTTLLATQASKVIGIEIDKGLVRYHQDENTLPPNVELIHDDILKVDFKSLQQHKDENLKIVANLPYSISNPFLFTLVKYSHLIGQVIVMLQKEVAERLVAEISTKQYGIPTVLLQSCCRIEPLMTLPPAEFHPRPKIDSMVIRMDFTADTLLRKKMSSDDFDFYTRVVRASFAQRRKTLLNNLRPLLLKETEKFLPPAKVKDLLENLFTQTTLSPKRRAESLSIHDFYALSSKCLQLMKEHRKKED